MGAVVLRLIVLAPLAAFEEPTLGQQITTRKWGKETKSPQSELRGSMTKKDETQKTS